MSLVAIIIPVVQKKSKEDMHKEFRWYDIIKKEMQYFKGGKLDFEYKEDPYLVKMGENERQKRGIRGVYRLLPKISDLQIFKNVRYGDRSIVEKWFNDYINYHHGDAFIVESTEKEVVFDVPDSELDNFLYQCERRGLQTRT